MLGDGEVSPLGGDGGLRQLCGNGRPQLAGLASQAGGFFGCGDGEWFPREVDRCPRLRYQRLGQQAEPTLCPKAVDGRIEEAERQVIRPYRSGRGADQIHPGGSRGKRGHARDSVDHEDSAPYRVRVREDGKHGRCVLRQWHAFGGRDDCCPGFLVGVPPPASQRGGEQALHSQARVPASLHGVGGRY